MADNITAEINVIVHWCGRFIFIVILNRP